MDRKTTTGQEKMWKVMRAMKRFTTMDLVLLVEVSWSLANRYCRALRHAGYLREDGKARQGVGRPQNIFRLVKDTGPKAPVIRPVCEVMDPNTGEKFCTEERY